MKAWSKLRPSIGVVVWYQRVLQEKEINNQINNQDPKMASVCNPTAINCHTFNVNTDKSALRYFHTASNPVFCPYSADTSVTYVCVK